jgi:drug/metabolite transporter (DMT)-like permease
MSGLYATGLLILLGESDSLAPVSQWWPALIAFGIFGTALPIVIFVNILRRAGPTIGSMNGYFLPPWTIFLGWLMLGETISLLDIAGMLIIFIGILLVTGGGNWTVPAQIRNLARKFPNLFPPSAV